MMAPTSSDSINEFLGSTRIFVSAVGEVIEQKLLHKAAGGRLSVSQLKLLKLVSVAGEHTIGDVAAFLGVSNAAVSKSVEGLVRRKLLRRMEGEADRRRIHLRLTSGGRRLIRNYDEARNRKLWEIFDRFSPDELSSAGRLLDRLSALIVDQSSRAEEICLQCGIYFKEKCLLRSELSRRCLYQEQKFRSDR